MWHAAIKHIGVASKPRRADRSNSHRFIAQNELSYWDDVVKTKYERFNAQSMLTRNIHFLIDVLVKTLKSNRRLTINYRKYANFGGRNIEFSNLGWHSLTESLPVFQYPVFFFLFFSFLETLPIKIALLNLLFNNNSRGCFFKRLKQLIERQRYLHLLSAF